MENQIDSKDMAIGMCAVLLRDNREKGEEQKKEILEIFKQEAKSIIDSLEREKDTTARIKSCNTLIEIAKLYIEEAKIRIEMLEQFRNKNLN